jgi:hypothetical protein
VEEDSETDQPLTLSTGGVTGPSAGGGIGPGVVSGAIVPLLPSASQSTAAAAGAGPARGRQWAWSMGVKLELPAVGKLWEQLKAYFDPGTWTRQEWQKQVMSAAVSSRVWATW